MAQTFEQKIYELNEKLNTRAPMAPSKEKTLQIDSFTQSINRLSQESQRFIQDIENRCQEVQMHIEKHQQFLLNAQILEDQRAESRTRQIQTDEQNLQGQLDSVQNQTSIKIKKIECAMEEELEIWEKQLSYKCKKIIKQIQKQLSQLKKGSHKELSRNPQIEKLQKQYIAKLSRISNNQQLKAERIRQLDKKIANRMREIYMKVGQKNQELKCKNEKKFEKMRRLFTLVIDL